MGSDEFYEMWTLANKIRLRTKRLARENPKYAKAFQKINDAAIEAECIIADIETTQDR